MKKHLINRAIRLKKTNLTENMWGGSWIPAWKGIRARRGTPCGESWEFSGHKDHPSRVYFGPGKESVLPTLIKKFPKEILGSSIVRKFGKKAPFLVKLIDAKDTLSLQVHPDEGYARRHEKDSGKFESWFIVDVEKAPGSGKIYLGFNRNMAEKFKNPGQFRKAFLETMEKTNHLGPSHDPAIRARASEFVLPFVNEIQVKKGDIFELPPGTIHAIGSGVRIFEIQQPSNVTYRIWDWNRPDAGVKKGPPRFRELHLKKAASVLNFSQKDGRLLKHGKFWTHESDKGKWKEENLIRNPQAGYAVNRLVLKGRKYSRTIAAMNEFFTLTVLEGKILIDSALTAKSGETVLIPACLNEIRLTNLSPTTVLFKSYCL